MSATVPLNIVVERTAHPTRFLPVPGVLSLTVPPMDMVPIIAVNCFGGVRPEESARMTWDMVDFKRTHIDLPGEITKDGDRRIVDMPDNLVEVVKDSDDIASYWNLLPSSAGEIAIFAA